ncbi:MAG: DUF2961 domain-containing protein, partial [Planctomycetota bacterium]
WWGEGDAKIWVDGESFPSIFGTGTEDYYAYSYGGQNRRFYDHPFHAQVRVMDFDQNYRGQVPIVRVTRGYSTETRTRAIDSMPFGESLQVDMEIWHWADCQVDYNAATYWYARPGAICNVNPSPEGAKRKVKKIARLIHSAERSSSPELPTVVLCLTDRDQTSIVPPLLVHAAKQCTTQEIHLSMRAPLFV